MQLQRAITGKNIPADFFFAIAILLTPNVLTPKVLRVEFCLFLKFGQAILVRILMLNF